jgi:hypothetical protein
MRLSADRAHVRGRHPPVGDPEPLDHAVPRVGAGVARVPEGAVEVEDEGVGLHGAGTVAERRAWRQAAA